MAIERTQVIIDEMGWRRGECYISGTGVVCLPETCFEMKIHFIPLH